MAELDSNIATRSLPLSSAHGRSAAVRLEPAAPASRISLRANIEDTPVLSKALRVTLPTKPKTSSQAGGRTALWLGPDEWLVIDEGQVGPMIDSGTLVRNGIVPDGMIADAAAAGVSHSATYVSHRNTAILISGPGAADAINAGCPQDLSLNAFPVGACSRTLFGKVEVVLLRTGEEAFRMEVWRSFSDYAFALLAEGARDAAL